MNDLNKILIKNGYFILDNIYDYKTLIEIKEKIKTKLNFHELRERIEAKELYNLGILQILFNPQIRYLINNIIPDGVLWHCMFLKTKSGQSAPHIKFNTEYGDWHRDRSFFYSPERVDFLDIMIYLNDVGENDGPFAFLSKDPTNSPKRSDPATKIVGKIGTVIISRIDWYHRATPNSGNTDRNMIRFSIQRNAFQNSFLDTDESKYLANEFSKADDSFLAFLFGENRSWYKNALQPDQKAVDIKPKILEKNYKFDYSVSKSLKSFIKKNFLSKTT